MEVGLSSDVYSYLWENRMTDSEFLSFIRTCTLSNKDIGDFYGHPEQYIRNWRNGSCLPEPAEARYILVRELTMLEHTRLSEQIQEYHARRFPGR